MLFDVFLNDSKIEWERIVENYLKEHRLTSTQIEKITTFSDHLIGALLRDALLFKSKYGIRNSNSEEYQKEREIAISEKKKGIN